MLSSRHNMVFSFRYALYSLFLRSFDMRSATIFNHVRRLQCPSQNRTCRFPTSGSSAKLARRAVAPCRCKGLGGVRCSVRCPTHVSASLCVLLPTPSSGPAARAGHYPDYSSTMSWSDCHAVTLPPHLFGFVGSFLCGTAWLSQVPMQTVG